MSEKTETVTDETVEDSTTVMNTESATAIETDFDPDYYAPQHKNRLSEFYSRFMKREYSYLVYAFLVPVVLNYLIYLAMGIHPFGNGSVLVLDLNGQYVYFYEALRNAVYGQTSLLYSFARAMGGEFLGTYAYYVASPFSYIVCLFPQNNILDALLCIFLLKTGISGLTLGYYLHKISSRVNKISVVTFAVLYSLCTYAVIQQHNSMWIDALMWLPLLTLGIEQLIKNYKYKLFIVMLALTLLSNFYIGYMVCLYTLIYFFYYYFSRNEKNRNNPNAEPHHFRRSFLRIAGASAIAVGISMVIVASAYYSLQFGKNTFSNPNFGFSIRFDLIDFFTKFLPGSYDTVRPEGLPFVYCGVLTLFCVPMYFMSKKFSVRERIFSACLILFFVLSFSINTLDIIWHGFQKPNWLNYRYSFMLCFLLIVFAYKAFGEIRKASGKVIALLAGIFLLFIAVAQKYTYHAVVERISGTIEFDQSLKDIETIWVSVICVVVFAIVLCVAIKTKHRENTALIICVLVCLEVFCNGLVCCVEFGDDVIYSSYSSYNSFVQAVRPLTTEIVETDPSFYRFEKNAHRKLCDNMALNVRGITNSTSTLNKDTISFLANMGYAARSHWAKYLGGNPLSDSLLGIKYIIGSENDNLDIYYDQTDMQTVIYNSIDYSAYLNKYALSIAYAVDDDVMAYPMTGGNTPFIRLNGLITAMLGDEGVEVFKVAPVTSVDTTNCTQSTIAGHTKYEHQNSSSDCVVTYNVTVLADGELFFYLPSDYAREVTLKVNGVNRGTFYGGETTRIVSLGSFTEEDIVRISMTLSADVLYVKNDIPPVFYIDMPVFEDCITRLASTQLIVGDDWTSSYLPGTLTTVEDDQRILTTLTYDKGWKVTVDGKPVETEKTLDALVSFKIDTAGEHTVVMKYRPTSFTLGLTISLLSLFLFILIIIFEKPIKAVLVRITDQTQTDGKFDDADADYYDPDSAAAYFELIHDDAPPESTVPDASGKGDDSSDAVNDSADGDGKSDATEE